MFRLVFFRGPFNCPLCLILERRNYIFRLSFFPRTLFYLPPIPYITGEKLSIFILSFFPGTLSYLPPMCTLHLRGEIINFRLSFFSWDFVLFASYTLHYRGEIINFHSKFFSLGLCRICRRYVLYIWGEKLSIFILSCWTASRAEKCEGRR